MGSTFRQAALCYGLLNSDVSQNPRVLAVLKDLSQRSECVILQRFAQSLFFSGSAGQYPNLFSRRNDRIAQCDPVRRRFCGPDGAVNRLLMRVDRRLAWKK